MKNIKSIKIGKYIKFLILLIAISLCQQVTLMKAETKTENNNLKGFKFIEIPVG